MSDLAYLIGELNAEEQRRVFVIGGSYPGALSAWFRERYPHLTVGAWSSSGVVNPYVDFWQFDEQVYSSSVKSGEACPQTIQDTMQYVTEQGKLRDQGQAGTIIDQTLSGASAGMRTDDWMFYYADIFVESVQYGNRTKLCDMLGSMDPSDKDGIVLASAKFGTDVAGVNPPDYDTRLIADTTVDTSSSARPWTFQYCTEYGWFQVPSEEHVMRSAEYLSTDFWYEMCERSFGISMENRPKASATAIDQGSLDISETNIFFANGTEDPWKWATLTEAHPGLNQVAHTSECNDCGHCVELYTPDESDPVELQETRQMVFDWIDGILGEHHTVKAFLQ